MFWFSLQFLFETFLIPRRTERNAIKMYNGLHIKYPLFLSDFNETCIFSTKFWKRNTNINFHKYPSSGSRKVPCRRTDGWTYRQAWRCWQSLFASLRTHLKLVRLFDCVLAALSVYSAKQLTADQVWGTWRHIIFCLLSPCKPRATWSVFMQNVHSWCVVIETL